MERDFYEDNNSQHSQMQTDFLTRRFRYIA